MNDLPTPDEIVTQINRLIGQLIEVGLADRQNAAYRRGNTDAIEVTFEGAWNVAVAMKHLDYAEIYNQLIDSGAYNMVMLDGALIQLMYSYFRGALQKHRLAFFPSPSLEVFQNDPTVYTSQEIYADVVAKNIVHFPIRFDYDSSDTIFRELDHPKSHLTLGQYENCRIPVTGPLTPHRFIDFIVRNFYHTGFHQYAEKLNVSIHSFDESISPSERDIVHISVPR